MYSGLVHAHSGLRWVVLIFLVAATVNAFIKWRGKKEYTEGDRKLALYTFMSTNIQGALGLILYFISEKVLFAGEAMQDKVYRFFTVEHFAMMLIAILIITAGYSRAKKATDGVQKSRIIFMYFLSALILILISIPWPFLGYGTKWF